MSITEENLNDLEDSSKEAGQMTVYEVGFSLMPTLPVEALPDVVAKIKMVIDDANGLFISEEFPVLFPLAYTISKTIQTKKYNCDEAYIGWIKFESNSREAVVIKKERDKNNDILRLLLIKAPRESVFTFSKILSKKEEEATPETKNSDLIPEEGVVNLEEIDKGIANLVIE